MKKTISEEDLMDAMVRATSNMQDLIEKHPEVLMTASMLSAHTIVELFGDSNDNFKESEFTVLETYKIGDIKYDICRGGIIDPGFYQVLMTSNKPFVGCHDTVKALGRYNTENPYFRSVKCSTIADCYRNILSSYEKF